MIEKKMNTIDLDDVNKAVWGEQEQISDDSAINAEARKAFVRRLQDISLELLVPEFDPNMPVYNNRLTQMYQRMKALAAEYDVRFIVPISSDMRPNKIQNNGISGAFLDTHSGKSTISQFSHLKHLKERKPSKPGEFVVAYSSMVRGYETTKETKETEKNVRKGIFKHRTKQGHPSKFLLGLIKKVK